MSKSNAELQSRRERRAAERGNSVQNKRARDAAAARQRRTRTLAGLTVVVVLVIVIAAVVINGLTSTSSTTGAALTNPSDLNPGSPLAVGKTAPNFTLSTADGKSYTLSQYRGKTVLLEFFAIWCPHCQAMAPVLNNLDQQYKGQKMQTVAVLASPYGRNYDTSGGSDTSLATKSDLTWFQTHFNVNHPALIDPSFKVVNEYGANSYPTIYVISPAGKISYVSQGEVTQTALSTAINKVLKS